MRLIFIITGLRTGGAELVLLNLLRHLDRSRYQPIVVSLLDEGDLGPAIRELDIPLTCLELSRPSKLLPSLTALIRLIRESRPDLIHGWMYHANLLALLARMFAKDSVPVLFSIHNALVDWPNEKPLTRWIIRLNGLVSRFANKVLYVSETSAEDHWTVGFSRENSLIIPNGFDCELFAPEPADRAEMRKSLGITDQEIVIGLIARYHPVKDHAGFLAAAARVAYTHPDVRFLLCGGWIDNQNQKLMDLIALGNLQGRVRLLGNRNDINRVLRGLDILALSSKSEASPGVVCEAMATGLPCVTTNVGACAEIIGPTGWLAEPGDPASLADALDQAIQAGPESRAQLGRAARTRIIDRYGMSAMIGRYEALYQQQSSAA